MFWLVSVPDPTADLACTAILAPFVTLPDTFSAMAMASFAPFTGHISGNTIDWCNPVFMTRSRRRAA